MAESEATREASNRKQLLVVSKRTSRENELLISKYNETNETNETNDTGNDRDEFIRKKKKKTP